MRHRNLTVIIVGLVIIISFALGFTGALAESRVKVIGTSGDAEFQKSGEREWKKVSKKIYLHSGDSVKTYEDSSVDLAFDTMKERIVGIASNSHVVIKLVGNEKIKLLDGEVYALIKKLPAGSSFEIRTPTAVCGARGTGWGAKGNKNSSTISSYEDSSYVSGLKKDGSKTKETTVPEKYETTVGRFMKLSPFRKISDEKYGKWDTWRDLVTKHTTQGRVKMERLVGDLEKIERQKERIDERISDDRIRVRDESKGAGSGSSGNNDPYREE